MADTLTAAKSTGKRISLPVCTHVPEPYAGPSKQEVVALRQQYLSPGLIRYYKDPLMVVEGNMQYVWDETGRRFLDAFAGIVTVSVGHCHPKVVKAVQEYHDHLSAPDNRAIRQKIDRAHAGRFQSVELVLHEQWLGSQRTGDPRRA
jgi:4-aminobutyrate aminotransferase-like enzyme